MDSARDPPQGRGLPHSEIPGSTVARTFPGLIPACHVLHRLSTPRHPPDALRSLTTSPPRPSRKTSTPRDLTIARGPRRGPHSGPHQDTSLSAERGQHTHAKRMPRSGLPPRAHAPAFSSSPLHHVIEDPQSPPMRGPARTFPSCSLLAPACGRRGGPRAIADRVGGGGPGPIRTADLTLIRGAL